MLMAGLSRMLSRILQSQPGCFSSASHDFSSSNKLTPAGLHGSWQNSERERKCGRSPKDWAQLSYSIMATTTYFPKQVTRKPRVREEKNRLLSWSEELSKLEPEGQTYVEHGWLCQWNHTLWRLAGTQPHPSLGLEPTARCTGGNLKPLPFSNTAGVVPGLPEARVLLSRRRKNSVWGKVIRQEWVCKHRTHVSGTSRQAGNGVQLQGRSGMFL